MQRVISLLVVLVSLQMPLRAATSSVSLAGINININVGPAAAPKPWFCEVSAFTKTFEAVGATKAEAVFEAKKNCSQAYHRMHCEDVKCDSPENSRDSMGWTCTLNPFTKTYIGVAGSRAEAKADCRKQCRAEYSDMFCEEPVCNEG